MPAVEQVARRGWRRSPVEVAAGVIVAVAFLWCFFRSAQYAWYVTYSIVAPYDDEGYFLVSVREFLLGRPLYDEVFSIYGPSYYAYRHVLSLFHGLPTQDITRATTLSVWMFSAAILGLTALWLTRSGVAATAAFCLMTVALQPLPNEAGHPQELLVALTSISVAVAACPMRVHVRVAMLASIATVACLAKINVGVFIVLAVLGTALPVGSGAGRQSLALGLAAVPAVLMWRHLSAWAWPYALASGSAVLTAVTLTSDTNVRVVSLRRGLSLAAAVLVPVVAIGAYLVARGSTLTAVVDSVFVRPALFPDLYINPFRTVPRIVAISLASAAAALFVAGRVSPLAVQFQPYFPAMKVIVGLYVIFWLGLDPVQVVCAGGLVVLALLAGDGRGQRGEQFGRGFLALSAALHTCTAYPVAGSQMWWSSFLLILAAVVCLWDGVATIRTMAAGSAAFYRLTGTALICLSLAVYHTALTPLASWEALYRNQVPLPYDGSTSTRVSPAMSAAYNWLVANLKTRCSAFVSLPGYNSLHLWTGVRPVTGFNAGAWMFMLNDDEQAAVVQRMRDTPRPCAVYHAGGVGLWPSQAVADRRSSPRTSSVWRRPCRAGVMN